MTPHEHLDADAEERAALFALGLLPGPEALIYEEHLAMCVACRAEVASLEAATVGLSELIPEVEPSPALRDEVLSRIRKPKADVPLLQPWKDWKAAPAFGDMSFIPGEGSGWEATAIPGIETRRLHVDRSADRVTMMVRMAPGTSYPAHLHGGDEECYVISGDLRVGDELSMRAGDYQMARKGSRHPIQSTEHGCVLFLVTSLQDEILHD